MSKRYAVEFKESILKRILPPNNGYIPEISRETGVPVDTLYTWRTKYRSRTLVSMGVKIPPFWGNEISPPGG